MNLQPIGARFDPVSATTEFFVWAPQKTTVNILINDNSQFSMKKVSDDYFHFKTNNCPPGTQYQFVIDGKQLPDPASRSQPNGVHGPSEVVDSQFPWTDHGWTGLPIEDLVFYELHTGTFSTTGDFNGIHHRIESLKELGITAIELMPVAQFPGHRNWGYDGVFPFAVQESYGGIEGLKNLVNICHQNGVLIFLDVVYNHLGPEGNYLHQFGPYYTEDYHTPWGAAINFDGPYSDGVRTYFLNNVNQWLEEFHFDGLRLDAVHAIFDRSAKPFLEEVMEIKDHLQRKLNRHLYVIAETESNDSRLLMNRKTGGMGLDGQWSDDFHHAIHTLLTKESKGYYRDFGSVQDLANIYRKGVCYDGRYSQNQKRRRGRSYDGIERNRLVVCTQNHDQIGNRCFGERLAVLVPQDALKLAAACLFLSPFLPLIFMGEELATTSPFLYFIDHQDQKLVNAIREGRKREFLEFAWGEEPPDPASAEIFESCRLNFDDTQKFSAEIRSLYKDLIIQSKWLRQHKLFDQTHLKVQFNEEQKWIHLFGQKAAQAASAYFNFSDETNQFHQPTGEMSLCCFEGIKQQDTTFSLQAYGFAFFKGTAT